MTPRKNPKAASAKRDALMDQRMTKADSLRSFSEFGSVVPPSQQAAMRKRRKQQSPITIMDRIKAVLSGGS